MLCAMKEYTLGVDTSNYTTSICLVSEGQIAKSVRRLLPVEKGQKGLRQSDALFHHTSRLPSLAEELFEGFDHAHSKITCVGVSATPRDAEGSYMPCFLAGVSFASAICASLGVPMYRFSHQRGHIKAAIHSCANSNIFEGVPFISFHVSGGTTEALLTTPLQNGYSCEIIGGTNDASCGQIVDRAGVLMGMNFPCGKELDALSLESTKKLPNCVSMKDGYFSMSGLENKVMKFLAEGNDKSDIASFVFESIGEALKKSAVYLREKHGNLPILFAGGVCANTKIRHKLLQLENTFFASTELSSDNACGTALLAYEKHYGKGRSDS